MAVVTFEAVSENIPLAVGGVIVAGAVKVTVTPLTGFWPLSKTVTTRGDANAVLMGALCGVPLVAVTEAGAPVVLVRLKFAARITPGTEAVTTNEPAVPFAVNAGDVAIPFTSVVAVAVLDEVLENVPPGPVDGAVNVTTTPLVGAPFVVTVATRAAPNAALIAWLCGVPLVAAIATTGVMFVVGVLRRPVVQPVRATAQRHAIASTHVLALQILPIPVLTIIVLPIIECPRHVPRFDSCVHDRSETLEFRADSESRIDDSQPAHYAPERPASV